MQEPQRHVECSPAPGLDGKQAGHVTGITGGYRDEVFGPEPGCQQ